MTCRYLRATTGSRWWGGRRLTRHQGAV